MRSISLISAVMIVVFSCAAGLCSYSQEKPEARSSSSQGSLVATCEGDLLSVDIKDASLEEVLRKLSDQTGISFSLPSSLSRQSVMVRFKNFNLDAGIDKILAAYDRIFIYNQPQDKTQESRPSRLREVRIYLHENNKKGESEPPLIIQANKTDQKTAGTIKAEKKQAAKASPGENAVKSLEEWAKDLREGDESAKVNAIQGLAKMGGAEALGYLASALEDPNPEVSGEAERLLTDLYASLEDSADENSSGNDPQTPIEGSPSFSIDSTGVSGEGPGGQIEVDIRITDVPEKIIGGGLLISYDPSQLSIEGVDVYDGSSLAGPWDKAMTGKVEKPENLPPGHYGLTFGNLSCVTPDESGSINIARARFNQTGSGDPQITISPIPGYDGFVGESATVYDPKMPPTEFKLY